MTIRPRRSLPPLTIGLHLLAALSLLSFSACGDSRSDPISDSLSQAHRANDRAIADPQRAARLRQLLDDAIQ